MKKCSVPECANAARSRGWCPNHYHRWQRNGHPTLYGSTRTKAGEVQKYLNEVVLTSQDKEQCLLWPFTRQVNGYASISVKRKSVIAHRLVCELVNGPPPTEKHEASHSCGRGRDGCVNPHHLQWKTHVENEADKIQHGTMGLGSKNNMAVLSEADVAEIRSLKDALTQYQIAAQFGISQPNVSSILNGKTWPMSNAK